MLEAPGMTIDGICKKVVKNSCLFETCVGLTFHVTKEEVSG